MKLTKREAGILEFLLEKKGNFKSIRSALAIKKSNLSLYARKLESAGLITIAREGREKLIALENSVSTGFFRSKASLPMIKLNEVLAGQIPFFLCFMLTKKRTTIAEMNIPAASAKRMLKKLRSIGIIFMPSNGQYELRQEAEPLAGFCRQILTQIYTAEAEKELQGIEKAVFSFDSPRELEAVFVTDQENKPKHYWPTAYAIFSRHGLELVSAGKFYYANMKPKLKDAIMHALSLSRDARTIAYASALVLINKIDPASLLKKKQRFGLPEGFVETLVEFIKSKGGKTQEGFPSWGEVEMVLHG